MTERAEHTAGPWKRSDYGQIVDPDGKDVCFRSVTTMCSGSEESIAEAEANTDLIAAAPDLLAALKAIQWFCDDPNGSEKGETLANGLVRLLPAARDAISRATGEA